MRRQPERGEQEAVKRLLSAMGAKFWVAGTVRKRGDYHGTMQTPGLPDLPLVFLPKRPGYLLVVIEVKSPSAAKTRTGGLSPEQVEVKRMCELANVPYIHGDLDTIIGWLLQHAFLKPANVPHYRVQAHAE